MATPVTLRVRPVVPSATSFTRTILRPETSTICLSRTFFHRSSSRGRSSASSSGSSPLRMRFGPSMPRTSDQLTKTRRRLPNIVRRVLTRILVMNG